MTLSETAPLRPADDDEIVDTEACCAVSPVPAATRSPVVRRAVLASAVMLALAGSVFARPRPFPRAEKKARDLHAFKGLMQGGDSSQCNYVCESDADCNSLTGPCVYCSGKGSGSGGTARRTRTTRAAPASRATTTRPSRARSRPRACKQSQANGHGCGKAGGVGATASKDGPITPSSDTKNSDKKENGGSTAYDIDDVSESGLKSEGPGFKALMQAGDSSQCNYARPSDADCNSLTGPCVYCSGKGSGSGGTCVSDEDDTGGTGLAGDDDTTKPSARGRGGR